MKHISKILLISFSILYSSKSFSNKELLQINNCDNLSCVRKNIDEVNTKIVELLSIRMKYVFQAGDIKLKQNIHIADDPKRASDVILAVQDIARKYNLSEEYVKKIFEIIVRDSIQFEQENINQKLNKKPRS